MLVNTATANWDVLFVNDAWSRITSARPPRARPAPRRLPARAAPSRADALSDLSRPGAQPLRARTRSGSPCSSSSRPAATRRAAPPVPLDPGRGPARAPPRCIEPGWDGRVADAGLVVGSAPELTRAAAPAPGPREAARGRGAPRELRHAAQARCARRRRGRLLHGTLQARAPACCFAGPAAAGLRADVQHSACAPRARGSMRMCPAAAQEHGRSSAGVAARRPASTEALDEKVRAIGIPGEASWPAGKADEYYFVTVRGCLQGAHAPPHPPPGLPAQTRVPVVPRPQG